MKKEKPKIIGCDVRCPAGIDKIYVIYNDEWCELFTRLETATLIEELNEGTYFTALSTTITDLTSTFLKNEKNINFIIIDFNGVAYHTCLSTTRYELTTGKDMTDYKHCNIVFSYEGKEPNLLPVTNENLIRLGIKENE